MISLGVRVLRFTNHQVLNEMSQILEIIRENVAKVKKTKIMDFAAKPSP